MLINTFRVKKLAFAFIGTITLYVLVSALSILLKGNDIRYVERNEVYELNDAQDGYLIGKPEDASPEVPRDSDSGAPRDGARFDPSQPKFVHVLSYQRSGSSVVGDLLQNMSQVFYVYEPLDAMYTAMYGTVAGWNVPSDIFVERNGSLRVPPQEELDMATFVMDTVFNCRFSKLPHQMLMHRFLNYFKGFMPDMARYGKCCKARDPNIFNRLDDCSKASLRKFCKVRFGDAPENQRTCREVLYHEGAWRSDRKYILQTLRRNHPKMAKAKRVEQANAFEEYFRCIANYSSVVLPCAATHLDTPCARYPIRATKTVRAFAEVDAALAERYTNFRYVHLVRDPRGTAKSRYLAGWARGLFEQQDPGRIAGAYCSIGQHNEAVRLRLEARRPGTTATLVFDDVTTRPRQNVDRLFRFIGERVSGNATRWLQKLERGRATGAGKRKPRKEEVARMEGYVNDTTIAREAQWKVFFKYAEVQSMHEHCAGFFRTVSYDWEGITMARS